MNKHTNIVSEPPKLDVLMPRGNNCCSVIAVSLLLNIPFHDAYENLMFEGYSQNRLMNTLPVIVDTINKLSDNGYRLIFPHKRKYGSIKTVGDYIIKRSHKNDGYVIVVPHHCFYVYGLTIYDGILLKTGVYKKFGAEKLERTLRETTYRAIVPVEYSSIE